MKTLDKLSQLLLDIHRSVGKTEPDRFRNWAFEQLESFINFDSAVWIQAILIEDFPVTQNVYLHNQPGRMLEEYAKWASDDAILEAILCNPGKCFLWRELENQELRLDTDMYREFESIYGLEDGISIMIPFGGSGIQSFLSLYRNQRDKPFTIDDCERFQAVAPHLVEAENALLTGQIRSTYDLEQMDYSVATISFDGHIKMAEMGFIDCLNQGWPDWKPSLIPADIFTTTENIQNKEKVVNGYIIRTNRTSEGFVLSIRQSQPKDLLTSREQQVAIRVADGTPYKVVAKELNISPSTVTNHINSAHSKLGVSSRTELRKILGD